LYLLVVRWFAARGCEQTFAAPASAGEVGPGALFGISRPPGE